MKRGFALIVTLSLMILLVIVAVGLLGLSSISMRAGGQGQAQAQAQANARLAMQMAIGELQRVLGPDQRISARASLVNGDKGEANLIGAWESWHWNPLASNGGPDYQEKKNKFRGWLVSNGDPEASEQVAFATTTLKNPVWLINPPKSGAPKPTNGDPVQQLRASMVTVRNSSKLPGGMAWAVMDESLKAPAHLPEGVASTIAATNEIAWRTAPPRAHPELLVPELAPSATVSPERMFTLPTAVLATGAKSEEILGRQNDLTVNSVGLATDVVNGGIKKDLTTAFENTGFNFASAFGSTLTYGTATEGGPKWDYLRSHYQLYKKTSGASAGTPMVNYAAGATELRPKRDGLDRSPATERLLPVIAKLQIMFSIVTHYNHIGDRVNFYNTKGVPAGNTNYGCPHLVYDPVLTLYNPYDVAIQLPKLRVRLWDPPVVFGFKKNNVWLRDEFANPSGSGFQGLAQFQIANEKNPSARRYFTMYLTERTSSAVTGSPGKLIRLEPGEVKVFSPWVESNWNWAMETAGGYTVRAFFDWNAGNDFGNQDKRPGFESTFGIQSVPGWDQRAGLQTDHLSYANGRPPASLYDFEKANNWTAGWLAIKLDDTFSVSAKPSRTIKDSGLSSLPDFQVDLLAAQAVNPQDDILRSYNFRFTDVEGEISGKSPATIIERTFRVGDLLQTPTDKSPGGKSPFALLTMRAKTTKDPKDVSMPWLHNHPVVEGADMNSRMVGNALDSYDLRFETVRDFDDISIHTDPKDANKARGFYGASVTADRGVSNVPMFRVPLLPASSLGDLIPANLAPSASLPRVTHPLGGSRAHPLIASNSVTRNSPVTGTGRLLDHTYLLNDALWDSTFFSTAATFTGGLSPTGTRKSMLEEFFSGKRQLLNPRLVPIAGNQNTAKADAEKLDGLGTTEFATQIGASMGISGAFNINSDSVDAWRSLLSSLRNQDVRGWKNYKHSSSDRTSFPRGSLPLGGDGDGSASASIDIQGQIRWAGFRALTDKQLDTLAQEIVDQIRRRGREDFAPSLSLAEFVNRRIGSPSNLHTLAGLLEEAIKEAGINDKFHPLDSNTVGGNEATHPAALTGLDQPEARAGYTAEGAPSMLTQGDLLMPLAGVMTARGDTFRIRSYGEARDASGKIVTARAWCEATVQRVPTFIDPSDEAWRSIGSLGSTANKTFGRRFIITSFRWLDSDEI